MDQITKKKVEVQFLNASRAILLKIEALFCRFTGMRPGLVLTVTALLVSADAEAQVSTFSFLQTDVSARAAGLNGSFVSMEDDPNLIFYNPAGLATLSAPRASVGYMKHLLDVNFGSGSYAQEWEGVGTVGIGITYIDYGSFTETDASSNVLGTFGASEFSLVGGVGTAVDDETFVGANLKFIYSSIAEYRSSGLALDLGGLYRIPSEGITVGASILNLGRQLSTYAGVRESLPLDVAVGITKRPEHLPVYLNLDFHRLNEDASSLGDRLSAFTFGAEFLVSESVRLRLGYSNQQRKELSLGTAVGLAGFSIGGGFQFQQYLLDYSFNSYGTIGGLHRISLGMSL